MEKQLTKALSLDEEVEFCLNALGLSDPDESSSMEQCYSIGCPNTKVCLDDVTKLTALLDTRAEINVMTKSVMYGSEWALYTDWSTIETSFTYRE